METVDVIIIGAGPGGCSAAIALAQGGKKVVLIDKRANKEGGFLPGGVCLHDGCIPTKTLHKAAFSGKQFAQACDIKRQVISNLTEGLQFQLSQYPEIQLIVGEAYFLDAYSVRVKIHRESIDFGAKYVVIATGSKAILPPHYDGKKIITSTEALQLTEIPSKVAIVGGGYIGCEFANVLAHYGANVTLIETAEHILMNEDVDVIRELMKEYKKRNIQILTNTRIEDVNAAFDLIIYAVGREANISDLCLEDIGLEHEEGKGLSVDIQYRTSKPHIYALGDVIDRPLRLAHVAEEEGQLIASSILGAFDSTCTIRYDLVPTTIFTEPIICSVGKKEFELHSGTYVVGRSFYKTNAMAQCSNLPSGFVKIIADKKTGKILGASAVGYDVDIHEIAVAMHAGMDVKHLGHIVRFHPSRSEATREAALKAAMQLD